MEILYQGDCLEIMKTLETESVDCVITSPPYPGVSKLWGDLYKDENFDKAHDFLDRVWDECLRLLRPGCKLIINIANTKRRPYLPNIARVHWWARDKVEPTGEIIWNKGYGQTGHAWGSFRLPSDPALADQHEQILVFRKFGQRRKPKNYDKINADDFKSWRNSIWNIPPAKASAVGHVAPFPIKIPLRLIILYTFKGETVLDPFSGSGTTGEACINLGRHFIGMEKEAKYVQLTHSRWKQIRPQPTLVQ
jgi:site-specific DNA-methyltransferase (adenine-specific)